MTPQMSIAITGKNMTKPAFDAVVTDANRAAGAVSSTGARMGTAMGDASFQTANLAAQFNDIGVMLASGQSPLILAIQQGTQISQVLGPMGAGQAVNALKTALLSLLSPTTLITVGTIAAGAALFQWLTSANDDIPKASEAMEDHEAAIRKAGDAYGYAEGQLESYAQRSQEVSVANLRRSNEAIAAALRAASAELSDSLSGDAPTMVDGVVEMVRRAKDEYAEFEPIILAFVASLEKGTADFDAFNRQVAAVGNSRPELQGVADEIILLAENAYDLWGAGKAGADGIDALGDAASRNIGQMRAMAGAFAELAGIALPNLDERENASLQRDLIMNNGTASASDRIKAAKAYADAIARIDTREAEEAAIRLARDGASAADNQAEAYARVIESLAFEAEMIGLSALEQEVLNNIRAAGVEIGSEEAAVIRLKTELLFEQNAAMDESARQQAELAKLWDDYGRIGKAAVRGIIDAMMDGKIEANEFGDILSNIGSSLLNMGLDGLFGGFGGGQKKGGFLGGLFGFSEGGSGIVGGPGGYAPGAADDTLFIAKAQKGEPFAFGQDALDGLAPRNASRGSLTLNISGLGLSAEQVGQLVNDAIDRFDRMSLPGRVQAINADPLARG